MHLEDHRRGPRYSVRVGGSWAFSVCDGGEQVPVGSSGVEQDADSLVPEPAQPEASGYRSSSGRRYPAVVIQGRYVRGQRVVEPAQTSRPLLAPELFGGVWVYQPNSAQLGWG